MNQSTVGTPRPAAWNSGDWIAAVMRAPDDRKFLEHVAAGHPLPFTEGSMGHAAWYEAFARASADGVQAGTVLAFLYGLERAGWDIPRDPAPSLSVAIDVVEAFGMEDNMFRNTPDGKVIVERIKAREPEIEMVRSPRRSTIETAWYRMRGVAHLWAAYALHGLGLMGSHNYSRSHRELMRTGKGLHVLLATARSVQMFAQAWQAPGSDEAARLLGPSAWLVPDGFMLPPRWPAHPGAFQSHRREWLTEALKSYGTRGAKGRRRARGSASCDDTEGAQ